MGPGGGSGPREDRSDPASDRTPLTDDIEYPCEEYEDQHESPEEPSYCFRPSNEMHDVEDPDRSDRAEQGQQDQFHGEFP